MHSLALAPYCHHCLPEPAWRACRADPGQWGNRKKSTSPNRAETGPSARAPQAPALPAARPREPAEGGRSARREDGPPPKKFRLGGILGRKPDRRHGPVALFPRFDRAPPTDARTPGRGGAIEESRPDARLRRGVRPATDVRLLEGEGETRGAKRAEAWETAVRRADFETGRAVGSVSSSPPPRRPEEEGSTRMRLQRDDVWPIRSGRASSKNGHARRRSAREGRAREQAVPKMASSETPATEDAFSERARLKDGLLPFIESAAPSSASKPRFSPLDDDRPSRGPPRPRDGFPSSPVVVPPSRTYSSSSAAVPSSSFLRPTRRSTASSLTPEHSVRGTMKPGGTTDRGGGSSGPQQRQARFANQRVRPDARKSGRTRTVATRDSSKRFSSPPPLRSPLFGIGSFPSTD